MTIRIDYITLCSHLPSWMHISMTCSACGFAWIDEAPTIYPMVPCPGCKDVRSVVLGGAA